MPDARCTRDLMRDLPKKGAHEHTGAAENIRHSLRNGFTAYNVLSPENGSFASVAFAHSSHWTDAISSSLTPAPRRQDHTSLPYALMPFAKGTTSVHRDPSLVGNDGRRPSERDGMAVDIAPFALL